MKVYANLDFVNLGTLLDLSPGLSVANGGTGSSTLTLHGILYGNGTGAIQATAALTNGQLIIGSTGAAPAVSTLTAGTLISIVNGAGSITVNNTSTPGSNNFGYLNLPQNPQASTYSFVLTDQGESVLYTGSTAVVWTIPTNASVAFPLGTVITVVNPNSTGNIAVTPAGGVSLFQTGGSTSGAVSVSGTGYNIATLYKEATDTWVIGTGGGGGGSGTVTSVALADGSTSPIYTVSGSPVTTSGTLTFTLATQSANTVFAGPTTGAAAQPTFRSLVVADIPFYGQLPQNTQASTYSLVLTDKGDSIVYTGSTAVAWTIPTNASVAFPLGTVITLVNPNTGGDITVTPAGGVSLFQSGTTVSGSVVLSGTGYNVATIYKDATNTWIIGIQSSSVTSFQTSLAGLTPSSSTTGAITLGGTLGGASGGTGVNNGSSTITIGGNVTFSGAHTFTGTLTANTSVTFPASGTLGYLGIPVNTQNANYSFVSTDNGELVYNHTGSSISYTLNTGIITGAGAITVYTDSATSLTIVQGSGVTITFVGTGSTGNRTLAQFGIATLIQITQDNWIINGVGLT